MEYNTVLRYLGYANQYIEPSLKDMIFKCMAEMKEHSRPKTIYKIYDISVSTQVSMKKTTLSLAGEDIKKLLHSCTKAAVMAATLGIEAERRIRYYERTDLSKGLILDACATAYIEEICDQLCEKIQQEASMESKYLTKRYSPGYGDLPLNTQREILSVLEAEKKIGLTCTEGYIMLPRKSVTAIVGFTGEQSTEIKNACAFCHLRDRCQFKNNGKCHRYKGEDV